MSPNEHSGGNRLLPVRSSGLTLMSAVILRIDFKSRGKMHFSGSFGCPASCCSNVGNGAALGSVDGAIRTGSGGSAACGWAGGGESGLSLSLIGRIGKRDRLDRVQRQFSAGLHHARIGRG